jgi:hypothetical protein
VRTVEEVLTQLECNAKATDPQSRIAHTLVSGKLRIDVSYLHDLQRVSWCVNGKVVSRAMASRALEHARAKPLVPFVDKR